MKKVVLLLVFSLCGWGSSNVRADNAPRGRLLELHSCDLYAGGCIVSSEATLDGRLMLRVWEISRGGFAGADLSGLPVAVLEESTANLAQKQTEPTGAVVYLPYRASPGQRQALVGWLCSSQPELGRIPLQTRVVPMQLARTKTGVTFTAGAMITLSVGPLESCAMGNCGEQYWYSPRTAASFFTVGANRASRVQEPFLHLKWDDGGKPNVFLARFGETDPEQNILVTTALLCGVNGTLF